MILNSADVGKISEEFYNKLMTIKEKTEFYCKEELKEKSGSNFTFALDENLLIHLSKIYKVLGENKNITIDTTIGKEIQEYYIEMADKFSEYENLLNNIFNLPNKSFDQSFFYMPFFNWVSNFIFAIKNVYSLFIEKSSILEMIEDNKNYKELIKLTKTKEDQLSKLIKETEERGKVAILKLEQEAANKKIIEVKSIYNTLIQNTKKSRIMFLWLFFGSCVLVLLLFLLLFFNLSIFQDQYIIPRTALMTIFFSFFTFIINDFRKRYNIENQIMDELIQKQNLVDAYSALLVIIEKFDDSTKEIYHNKMLTNIIDNILTIKNHGFLSKKIMQDSPNIANDALRIIIENLQKNKDEKQD